MGASSSKKKKANEKDAPKNKDVDPEANRHNTLKRSESQASFYAKVKEAFSDESLSIADEETDPLLEEQKHKLRRIAYFIRLTIFSIIWIYCFVGIMFRKEAKWNHLVLAVPGQGEHRQIISKEDKDIRNIELTLTGRFNFSGHHNDHHNQSSLQVVLNKKGTDTAMSNSWLLALEPHNPTWNEARETMRKNFEIAFQNVKNLEILFKSTDPDDLILGLNLRASERNQTASVIAGALLLFILYALIVSSIVDKAFASLLICTAAVATLCYLDSRPSISTVIGWIDADTLMLLFGMMILVSLFAETGIFDYMSIYAYKFSRGRRWNLMIFLCIFSTIGSAILDSVTMTMLLTPVAIRLCEIMEMRINPVLITIILTANMGGSMTPFGDPANIMISQTAYVKDNEVKMLDFIIHLAPCLFFIMLIAILQIYLQIRDLHISAEEEEKDQRYRIIRSMKTAADTINPYSEEQREMKEGLMKQAKDTLKARLQKPGQQANFQSTLKNLKQKYKIEDKPFVIVSLIAVTFAIICFLLSGFEQFQTMKISWIAVTSLILLLILGARYNMVYLLARVDWATLFFFTTLFITTEAVVEMGLIDWIGDKVSAVILSVDEEYRIIVTVILLLWSTAVTSTLIDNIPVSQMMLKLAISLHKTTSLDLPLAPMLWAISLGTCLGGNATMIGASANVVGVGLAESYGHKITFLQWFKIGFPIMLTTTTIATAYLYLTHILPHWY